jgi:hypothetical protein
MLGIWTDVTKGNIIINCYANKTFFYHGGLKVSKQKKIEC